MPELPDVEVYREALARHVEGRVLERLHIASPFVLRTVDPPASAVQGQVLQSIERLGKRIVLVFDAELFAAIHLMIAGRLRWRERSDRLPARRGLASFDFGNGSVWLTEEGSTKRAAMHVVRGRDSLAELDRGGLEIMNATEAQFRSVLERENHTLKRALTDPSLFSGIGNAYSDEILHRARLSPVKWTSRLDESEARRLYQATHAVLAEWTARIRREVGEGFPEKVTAFREGMAVHGRYGKPCPACGKPVQRVVHAENESNYCAQCQTQGKLLADRALSRLLHEDWPDSLEELEERKRSEN